MKFEDIDGNTWENIREQNIKDAPKKYRAELQAAHDADDDDAFDVIMFRIYS